jgi:hypothetical protein
MTPVGGGGDGEELAHLLTIVVVVALVAWLLIRFVE